MRFIQRWVYIAGIRSLLAFVAFPVCAHAAVEVFVVSSGGSEIVCGARGGTWIPGLLARRSDFTTFQSFEKILASQRNKIKRLRGTARTTLQRKIAKNSAKLRRQRPVCRQGPPAGTTPTPTPIAALPVFDGSGSVTSYGKSVLGIPSEFSASIGGGRTVFQNNCVGCHVERTNRTFSNLRTNIARPPMFFDSSSMPDSSLAELTAYLNRFRE